MADDVPQPRRGASDNRWQGQAAGSYDRPEQGKSRRFWLVTLTGIFLALFSVVVLWALLLRQAPPPPVYLTISIAEHNDRLFPPLASTRKDAERILRHFPSKKQPETKDKQLLRREMIALKDRPENESLILHLTAQAIVREKKVYLIPGDAQPDEESTWLDVNEVLDAMQKCGAKKKLLILDLAHNFTDPRLGVLADRVAESLEAILQNAKLTFPILCPCSAGQYSLTAEALQGSVFAYYLDQGLQGHADANKDRAISVKEISAFLEARVDRWARENRGLRQRPRLFFDGVDFIVANVHDEFEETPTKLDSYPDRLQKAWAQRDVLRHPASRRAPRLLRKLEANLLRQERLWRGGANQKLDWKALDQDAQNLLIDLARDTTESLAPPRSLTLALKKENDNPKLVDAIMTILANTKDSSKKEDINDKIGEELLKKLGEAKSSEFPELASCVVEALSNVPQMKPDDVRVAQKALLSLKPRERFVEHLYLQRIIDFANKVREKNDPETWVWHSDKMQIILQTMRSREALIGALNREPGLLPWLGDALLAADKDRQEGERKVLLERPSAWKEGFTQLQSAKRKFEEAVQTFETLRRGRVDLDRAYAELPDFIGFVCDWPEFDMLSEKAWFRAAGEAKKLQDFFAAPPTPGSKGRGENVPNYQNPFADLDKAYQRRLLAVGKEEGPGALQQIHCLLDLPFLNAKERASLLTRQRDLAGKLHAATEKLDKEDNANRRVASTSAEKRNPDEKNIGLVRARMTLEMLQLAGFVSKEKLRVPADDRMNPEDWTKLEQSLRDHCGKELLVFMRRAKALPVAEALNRLVSPWETEVRVDLDLAPSRRLAQTQRKSYFHWLADRYDAESAILAGVPANQSASEFYAEAARELRLKSLDAAD